MALSREITLTIDNYNITLDKEIKIYEYDAINLCFTIQECGIVMRDGKAHNRVMPVVALKAYMLIETPQGTDSVEATNIVRNKIMFSLGNKYSRFVGTGKMQIILKDFDGCRITLPEFNYEVKQSINTGWDDGSFDVLITEKEDVVITDELGRPVETTKISEFDETDEITPQTYTMVINEDGNKKIKLDTMMESISEMIEFDVEEIDRRIDEMIEVYDDEEVEVEFPSLHNDVERIKGEINEISESLDNKTNLTNKRIEVINEKNDSKGIVDFANFSGQGNSNAPIGIVFHHYTDGKLIQIDNVGENNDILTLKNANNPNRRTDKPSEFVGNGNFLKLIKTSFNNGVKKEDDIFRINSLGQFAWTNTNTVQFSNALFEDNGMWAYKYIASPKRTYFEQKLNGDRIISEITDNGVTVEFTNKQETKQNFSEFSSLEFAKGGVLKTLTNVINLITEKNDDGIWGMSFSSKNNLENFAQFQNGSEKIAIVTDKSFDFRAISFIKPLTDYEIGYLPRYSIFIREKDNALCFKDSNLEVKVINLS